MAFSAKLLMDYELIKSQHDMLIDLKYIRIFFWTREANILDIQACFFNS